MPSASSAPLAPQYNAAAGELPPKTSLSPQQVQAANLLAAGRSVTQVALDLSVGRATLYRWQQDATFVAYFNELVRERTTEVTALASSLATRALRLIQEKLEDPKTPLELQIRLAFRILSLYSRPSFLRHLSALPDEPEAIAATQLRQSFSAFNLPQQPIDGSDLALYPGIQSDRLNVAAAFDAAYPDPLASWRDKMRQNGAPGALSHPA